ncbi:GntR family transcriptional regulator [Rhizobium sp. Leaf384]|uniref:aminotransferase-like domain-containing protein n=1 Tax=unclassified Rhizobium TaxID=2613769 RepID=UPI000713AE18|nr:MULTISPECIES: PLP-dependent aminotransferase family protein [unclassified Rhizobium]KQS79155.1 GntR family transcriptional regulator [Rhizobium sp. Leaf384]KQS82723.1 GntR family transcriptional regulator [Rhizobium sp. Leaf383]
MTNWLPDLSAGDGPLYLRLAQSIEAAIDSGVLPPGEKLPAQRNLAFDVGVTLGTVSRAYALVHERGLVAGEVGRGTYVRERKPHTETGATEVQSLAGTQTGDAPVGKLRFDSTGAPQVGQAAAIEEILKQVATDQPTEVSEYTRSAPLRWQEAGMIWLSRAGWEPDAESIVATQGVHAAIISVVAAVTAPGDRILFENLTYSQVARALSLMGRRILAGDTDAQGLVPEDFERICQQQHPAVVFLMPTLHNPTLAGMDRVRRQKIADIAQRYNVLMIEDDIYGILIGDAQSMLASLAPERTFVVSGLSKSVGPGVRGGWVSCPRHFSARVKIAHKMLSGGTAFLLAECAARLVLSGAAREIRTRVVAELAARETLARESLKGYDFRSLPQVPFLWLHLPEPWLSGTFKAAALEAGVMIDGEDEFKAGRSDKVHHRVRIAFSNHGRDDVRRGFELLRTVLDGGLAGYDSAS